MLKILIHAGKPRRKDPNFGLDLSQAFVADEVTT
jgi:hypothetical protein